MPKHKNYKVKYFTFSAAFSYKIVDIAIFKDYNKNIEYYCGFRLVTGICHIRISARVPVLRKPHNLKQEVINMPKQLDFISDTSDLMQRETDYNLNLLISKKLLENGLITQKEYAVIDTILKKKYRPNLSVFISENP